MEKPTCTTNVKLYRAKQPSKQIVQNKKGSHITMFICITESNEIWEYKRVIWWSD